MDIIVADYLIDCSRGIHSLCGQLEVGVRCSRVAFETNDLRGNLPSNIEDLGRKELNFVSMNL